LLWEVDPWRASFLGAVSVGGGLFYAVEAHLLRRVVEAAEDAVAGQASLVAPMAWAGGLALAAVGQAAILSARRIVGDGFQEMLRGAIEERCFRHAQALPLERFETPAVHDQLARTRQGMERRLFSTMSGFWNNVTYVSAALSLLAYLAQFSWVLPLVLVLGTLPGVAVRQRQRARYYALDRQQTPDQRRFTGYHGVLTGRAAAAEIRLFDLGSWLIDQTMGLWSRLHESRLRLARKEVRAQLLADAINALTYIGAISLVAGTLFAGGVGGSAAGSAPVNVGVFAALFFAVEEFQRACLQFAGQATNIHNDLYYVGDFFDFLDEPRLDLSAGEPLPTPASGSPAEIHLEDVSFTYPGAGRPAIQGLSLTVRPGERIALVGENGAGKSTLARLLMGLHQPASGRVTVAGVDATRLRLAGRYAATGAVFQTFARYQTTVRENIGFGWEPSLDLPGAIEDAAARSGADEVAAALPDGLDAKLGKDFHDGHELSVGQWQKLAVARAYVRPAELLVLDEPTASLDASAEAAVYEHFARMADAPPHVGAPRLGPAATDSTTPAGRHKSVVLVSHRLGSCRLADRILVLKDGRFVEEGTHAQLVAAGGEYAELFRLQAEWYR